MSRRAQCRQLPPREASELTFAKEWLADVNGDGIRDRVRTKSFTDPNNHVSVKVVDRKTLLESYPFNDDPPVPTSASVALRPVAGRGSDVVIRVEPKNATPTYLVCTMPQEERPRLPEITRATGAGDITIEGDTIRSSVHIGLIRMNAGSEAATVQIGNGWQVGIQSDEPLFLGKLASKAPINLDKSFVITFRDRSGSVIKRLTVEQNIQPEQIDHVSEDNIDVSVYRNDPHKPFHVSARAMHTQLKEIVPEELNALRTLWGEDIVSRAYSGVVFVDSRESNAEPAPNCVIDGKVYIVGKPNHLRYSVRHEIAHNIDALLTRNSSYNTLQKIWSSFPEGAPVFEFLKDSNYVPSLQGSRAGHPGDNASELFASFTVAILEGSDRFRQALLAYKAQHPRKFPLLKHQLRRVFEKHCRHLPAHTIMKPFYEVLNAA